MADKGDADKIDDVMLPGYRFHPTDEELVGFYLKRKIQQRSLPIELIKQVDIYKYDPWDLPKLASSGEKEWYFYCPRDRKYRNSARPNRVTGGGFWKATGTDRPIYSSDGTKCIGLKKSLVFYRGRAAKGIKTDWMMHEFRLPNTSESAPPKRLSDKNFSLHDSWAICRIFKKTNSLAQRALSHNWISPLSETSPDMFPQGAEYAQYSSENISCTTETGSTMHQCTNNDFQPASIAMFSALNIPSCKPLNGSVFKPSLLASPTGDIPCNFVFSPPEMSGSANKCSIDVPTMLFNLSPTYLGDVNRTSESIEFEGSQQHFNSFTINSSQDMQEEISMENNEAGIRKDQRDIDSNNEWGNMRSIGFPFSIPDSWKPNLQWDSPNCPSEISTNKCYT
ncbi:hypothetical protein ACH5RR_011171 [Cinchona calisaya]|uniref:NAC domain-containing protein n=1 Tax=Cinchona calisaya TaxID=153742 RepID=A0ABD3A7N1_9GENT